MHLKIKQVEGKRQTLFADFLDSIDVSAVSYLYISLDFLKQIMVTDVLRNDALKLADIMNVVIWFFGACSII